MSHTTYNTSVMTARTRRRRLLLLCAIDDVRGWPIPVFDRRALNRAVDQMARAIRRRRTARRYHRRDNATAVREAR